MFYLLDVRSSNLRTSKTSKLEESIDSLFANTVNF